jgi:competence protein ComEA
MRSIRGTEPGRGQRADAAARRLASLAADIGAADHDEPAAPVPAPALPHPGRHASRRRVAWPLPAAPSLGAPQLTVLAVVVAAGIALTAWWVVRDQADPLAPAAVASPVSAEPLVAASSAGPGSAAVSPSGSAKVTVDVTGKVRRPGIVVLDAGARVVDALRAAGGGRPGVDLGTINLARVLVDGEQIVVGGPAVAVPSSSGGTAPPGVPTAPVNLNTATEAELETLPDVGPVTAQSIVAWRDEHGGFSSVDELLEVDGIGEVTLEKLTPFVTV